MRLRAALGLLVVLALAGCGNARHAASPAPTRTLTQAPARPPLQVGVVGALTLDVPGVAPVRGTLGRLAGLPLVLVSAQSADLKTVADAARANPRTHYALVGGSTSGDKVKNLLGVVLRDDEAAQLAGVVAGLTAAEQGGAHPRVAWIGPEERRLAGTFARGARSMLPNVVVFRQWSRSLPARCKEAALTAMRRGAVVVMAHKGMCADAVVAAAHQQNLPGLRIDDFELPSVAAEFVARDALGGVYRGSEDLVFGAASGAVGIRALDPRISVAAAARARAVAQQIASGQTAAG
jgi:ABC transporter substrate-binding protein PnrA-like